MKLFKSKKFIIIFLLFVVIGFFISEILKNPKVSSKLPFYKIVSNPQISELPAPALRDKLRPSLPIYIENFKTSVGITTTINVYSISKTSGAPVILDIYGIDYHLQEIDPVVNPDAQAFRESFIKAKEELKTKGYNIKNLTLMYGTKQYIRETMELWIDKMGLL